MKNYSFHICGIDPGLTGALCSVYTLHGRVVKVEFYDTPVFISFFKNKRKTIYNIEKMVDQYAEARSAVCFIEKAQAMPKQGTVSMFHTGEGYGIWKGIIVSARSTPVEINSRTWKKEHNVKPTSKIKKDIKKADYDVAINIWNNLDYWENKEDNPFVTKRGRILDGRADAFLIALYGLQHWREYV